MAADQVLKPESTNICCAEWKKKCGKLMESRSALRQAVKVLEQKLNEIEAEAVNLKKAYEEERVQAKIEKEEKLKEFNAKVSLENEVCNLKSELTTLQKKFSTGQDGKEDKKDFQACISEKEKEINKLKELLEREKIRADSEKKNAEKEKKKAVEAWKLLEIEKNKIRERGIHIDKIEADKSEAHRVQLDSLAKEASEAKVKLASEMSKLKEATKRFEAEKHKLLAEKKYAESEMAKAQERLEVEKQNATREKRRADAEMVKVEKQKKLAEDNWNKAMEEKQLANQKSQQLEETKQTIEYLKQKMHELLSSRKPVEMSNFSFDTSVNAESTKAKLLESRLKLEKLRRKHIRKKFKLEASQRKILQIELGHLKLVLFQAFHRLDMLDTSFSQAVGSIDNLTKSGNTLNMQKSNFMRKFCSLEPSQIHGQCESEHLSPCCTTVDAHNPLSKAMYHIPHALSGGNYAESITGIDSKLKPLVGGSKRTILKSSALNSSAASFSDGQLMGSQERGTFPVTTSAKLAQENLNARAGMSNPSDKDTKLGCLENLTACVKGPLDIGGDREVNEHRRKRKRMLDNVEDIAHLSSKHNKLCLQAEKGLCNLQGVLYRNVETSLEKGGKMVPALGDNLQGKDGRPLQKRKKASRTKVDVVPGSNKNKKKSIGDAKAEFCEDTNVCRHAFHPICGERISDAANDFDGIFSFDGACDDNYMRLLELDDAVDEERYKRAIKAPLSPYLPEIDFHEVDAICTNKFKPLLEEALHKDLLRSRGDLVPSTRFDVIDVEITSNEKFNVSQDESMQARKTEFVEISQIHSSTKDGFIGVAHNQLHEFYVIFHNVADNDGISRVICATKNCIARCSLVTQTEWTVSSILTALKMEEKLLQKEKVYVLLSLLLFNFTMTTMKFGKLLDGNLIPYLKSYAEHVYSVMSDAETRILFLQNYFHELLSLIEEFLIGGVIINIMPAEALSECDSKAKICLDGVNLTLSPEGASNEQLVAGGIILASVCAAADYVGFLCEASYNFLRLCRWDSFVVLLILHSFAYLGGEEYFTSGNYGLMMTVLKSLVICLEGGNLSVATTSCLLVTNKLHAGSHSCDKCPFLDGAESVDNVAFSLLEKIKCLLQGVGPIQCANDVNCDMSCFLKKDMISASQPDALNNVAMCHLSDILSLVELVAHKMSWHWTNIKLVPQLLNILDSCVVESFAVPIVVLLGQLGRLGVDVGGYEDGGVEQLRRHLSSYLCHDSSVKASVSLQIATANTLLGLLPLDLETFVQSNFSLQGHSSKSVSGFVENLRKWFSGLGSDQRVLLCSILESSNVYRK